MQSTVALAAGALLVLAACGGGDARAAGPTVRDSAGIRIVQNEAPAWKKGQAWRVAAEPVTDVGVAEGDANQQFARVSDAVRLSDGTLMVADGQVNELRAFDAQGRYLRSIGRSGGGPGEFGGLEQLHLLPGDTVAAFDYLGRRLSFFTPAGTFVRSVTLEPVDGTLRPRPLGVFADGSMVVAPLFNPIFRNSPRPTRDTVALALYSAAGRQSASLGRVPGREMVTLVSGGGADRMAVRDARPFGLATFFAVHGSRLLVGENARYELVERRPDGAVVRLVRRSGDPQAVTKRDREAYLERRRGRAGDGASRGAEERLLKSLSFPEHKPYFAGLRLDAEGNAWVERHPAPGADTPWDVFDAEGRLLGTVTTPAGLRVTQIGPDFIVGVWTDELDVPHVRVHRIQKPAAR
ncbi:MAG: hypothetical protein KY467_03710 [Gemmatimonadetes bacterium]|nr:hypothetical protein [Gemmatimonadota bacterium]